VSDIALVGGAVVQSNAGKDKGGLYLVVAVNPNGDVWIADGRKRKEHSPKKKNPRHLRALAWNDEIGKRLQAHEKVSDELLRRVLQEYGAMRSREG
jgi:ribosomal protein L14E/L6E/L27E